MNREDDTFNDIEKQSNLGKQILRGMDMTTRIITDANGRKHITTEPLLYAQRTWVPLTNEEIGELYRAGFSNNTDFARAVEARLKEKNDY